jgi:hypothetical protein
MSETDIILRIAVALETSRNTPRFVRVLLRHSRECVAQTDLKGLPVCCAGYRRIDSLLSILARYGRKQGNGGTRTLGI